MNPAQAQGVAGHQNGPGGQNQNVMYRPETMRTIRYLTEDERGKYEKGLSLLWKQHDASPQGSPENNEARRKIIDFGRMLITKVQQRKQQLQVQQQQQAQQTQQLQQGQTPQQMQPPQQQLGQAGQATQQAQPTQHAQLSATSGVSNDNPAGPPPTPTATAAPMSAPAAGASAPQQGLKFPPNILSHINEITLLPPPNSPDKEKWITEIKVKYGRALMQMEQARTNLAKLEQMIKDRKEKGGVPPFSADEEKAIIERKALYQKQHSEAYNFVTTIRKQYTAPNPAAKPGQNGAAAQGVAAQAGNQGRPQPPARPAAGQQNVAGTQTGAAAPGGGGAMQNSTAAVNAAFEAAKNQQLAAGRIPGTPSLPGQARPAAHPGQSTAPAQAQPSPITQAPAAQIPASQSHGQQQAQIKVEPGIQQQAPNLPAPLNTAIATGINAGLQATGTPTQASARVQTPQSSTPTNNNIRPLTHAAAINLAAQQRSGSIGGQPSSGPASAPGVIGSQQPGHPHAHPATQTVGQTLQTKMPIPKNLHEKATQMPTPVAPLGGAGGGRPTFSGGTGIAGGVMNQPALAKTPAYQLEGEGERVLNKKKLDELVRQVCGGIAEGQEGNVLTPEVEEAVLNLADSFTDDVLHAACRMAKERGSKVLEIRDMQLVLERIYNIRIPGYSSDELRTVRKVQPNAHWITKMSAVQAAKVMPGKGDL